VGIATPRTFLPRCDGDVAAAAREVGYPLIIKPQTQAGLKCHLKGTVVWRPADLSRAWGDLRSSVSVWPDLTAHDPDAGGLLLQPFLAAGSPGVYSLSGFAARDGAVLARASRKLLQRPRRAGVGLCFEEADPIPGLVEKMATLCRHVGYYGVFEAEFLEVEGQHLLIDFNPRLFGQIAFDVARGLDLPLLAYRAATGGRGPAPAAKALPAEKGPSRVFCNRIHLRIHLALQRLAGRMERSEARAWLSWLARHRGRIIDPALAPDDPLPGLLDLARSLIAPLRHPRAVWRDTAR
jgi:predicted ATP-grasp superfamily ATP-dependent carboligase